MQIIVLKVFLAIGTTAKAVGALHRQYRVLCAMHLIAHRHICRLAFNYAVKLNSNMGMP